MKMNQFLVYKDKDGYFPLTFITRNDVAGRIRAEEFLRKTKVKGANLVVVEFNEIPE